MGCVYLSVSQGNAYSPDDKKVVRLPRWSSRSADSHAYHNPPPPPRPPQTTCSPPTSWHCHPSVSPQPLFPPLPQPPTSSPILMKNGRLIVGGKKPVRFLLSFCSVCFTLYFFILFSIQMSHLALI